jgi:FSR family fosmidomycin resistance protein-like MFS transporter
MTQRRQIKPSIALALFALLHAVNDQYTSFLSASMPLLIERFGFGLGIAGLLSSVQSISTSFAQPLFGWILDRTRRQPSILVWPVITAVSLSVFGLVPAYTWLFPLLVIGGLSTAAFHPHASSAVPAHTKANAGLGMAIFVSGGTIGYAVGPVFILSIINAFGMRFSWLAALPTILLVAVLARLGLAGAARPEAAPRRIPRLTADRLKPLLAILLVVVFRSTIGTAYTAFLGVHLRQIGFPIMQVGLALMTFTFAGAFGGMLGGIAADRVGRKAVIVSGLSLIAPVFWLLLRARGLAVWPMMAAAGFAISTFNPITVLMAQDLLPESRGTASGLIMGLGWSVGGLLVGVVGGLAEAYGLTQVLSWILVLVIPAILIASRLPSRSGQSGPLPGSADVTGSAG